MHAQSARTTLLKNSVHKARSFIRLILICGKLIAGFFRNLYPGNWFNDFRNIEITMEEFSESAKTTATAIPATTHQPGSFLANTPAPSAN